MKKKTPFPLRPTISEPLMSHLTFARMTKILCIEKDAVRDMFKVTKQTYYRWGKGKHPIPLHVERLIMKMMDMRSTIIKILQDDVRNGTQKHLVLQKKRSLPPELFLFLLSEEAFQESGMAKEDMLYCTYLSAVDYMVQEYPSVFITDAKNS